MKLKCVCLNCKIEFNKTRSSFGKYCGNKCQFEFQYKEYIKNWKSGLKNGARGLAVSKHIRKYLFEKYNNKCCLCGWCSVNKTSGLIPLEVDHLDGDHKNNIESNLRLICPNCHSLTSNYKSLNKGNGRFERMERYHSGQSY